MLLHNMHKISRVASALKCQFSHGVGKERMKVGNAIVRIKIKILKSNCDSMNNLDDEIVIYKH